MRVDEGGSEVGRKVYRVCYCTSVLFIGLHTQTYIVESVDSISRDEPDSP